MIIIKQKGKFKKVTNYLVRSEKLSRPDLIKYGEMGVQALYEATPKDTGTTALSWRYKITSSNGVTKLEFHNVNIQNGCCIAIILQYGHTTKNGYYIKGIDYINPALKPIVYKMAEDAWKEMSKQ